MEYIIAIVSVVSTIVFFIGLGQMIGSEGEEYKVVLFSGMAVLACMIWVWGYLYGSPSVEVELSEDEEESE